VVDYLELFNAVMAIGAPALGATLILAGIFLRLLGKGISYLILGAGIGATAYVMIVPGNLPQNGLPVEAVFAAGIAASVALALALRALTAAIEFGFFTVGWFLLLQEVLPMLGLDLSVMDVTGVSVWMGSTVVTTVLAELLMKRLRITRRLPVPAVAAIASSARGARR
jgi:hypothetical protein